MHSHLPGEDSGPPRLDAGPPSATPHCDCLCLSVPHQLSRSEGPHWLLPHPQSKGSWRTEGAQCPRECVATCHSHWWRVQQGDRPIPRASRREDVVSPEWTTGAGRAWLGAWAPCEQRGWSWPVGGFGRGGNPEEGEGWGQTLGGGSTASAQEGGPGKRGLESCPPQACVCHSVRRPDRAWRDWGFRT